MFSFILCTNEYSCSNELIFEIKTNRIVRKFLYQSVYQRKVYLDFHCFNDWLLFLEMPNKCKYHRNDVAGHLMISGNHRGRSKRCRLRSENGP
jgi:hypothetical protein